MIIHSMASGRVHERRHYTAHGPFHEGRRMIDHDLAYDRQWQAHGRVMGGSLSSVDSCMHQASTSALIRILPPCLGILIRAKWFISPAFYRALAF